MDANGCRTGCNTAVLTVFLIRTSAILSTGARLRHLVPVVEVAVVARYFLLMHVDTSGYIRHWTDTQTIFSQYVVQSLLRLGEF